MSLAIPRLTLKTTFYVATVVLAREDQVLALKVLDFQELILHSANISKVAVKTQHLGTLKHFENADVCGTFYRKKISRLPLQELGQSGTDGGDSVHLSRPEEGGGVLQRQARNSPCRNGE